MSNVLLAIKFGALGLTAVLGVLGISRSAKSPDGKITRWGRFLIIAAFLSFLLTAAAQFLELQGSIEGAEQAVSRLSLDSARQQEMLEGITRTLFPLSGASFELFMQLPADQPTQDEFREHPDTPYELGAVGFKHTNSELTKRLSDCMVIIKMDKMRIGKQGAKSIRFVLEPGALIHATSADWNATKPSELLVMATTPNVAPGSDNRIATLDDLVKTVITVETCDALDRLSTIYVYDPKGRPIAAKLHPVGRGELSGFVFSGQLEDIPEQ